MKNLRAISDDKNLEHVFSLEPVRIGELMHANGSLIRVVNNYETIIVSGEIITDLEEIKDFIVNTESEWKKFAEWGKENYKDFNEGECEKELYLYIAAFF